MKDKFATIATIVVIILIIVGIAWWLNNAFDKADKAITSIQDKVGTYVVYGKDTLQVTDYSLIHQTYTLSNGKEYNYKLVEKMKTVIR